jgi:hypothetical protein
MENIALLVVAGLFVPSIVSFLKKQDWSTRVKTILSVAVAFAVTAGVMAVQGSFDNWDDFVANLSVIYATSTVVYNTYFDKTALNEWLTSIGIHS